MTVPQEMEICQAGGGVRQDEAPPPRVLFVSDGAYEDGAKSGRLNAVMDLLKTRGWQVDVCFRAYSRGAGHNDRPPARGLFRTAATKLAFMRDLVRTIPRYDTVHLFFMSNMSFFRQVAPALLLAKFFGKKVVLSYYQNQAEAELEKAGRWILALLRTCDTIIVSSNYLAEVFSRYHVTVEVVPDGVDTDLFKPRIIESVQPRIIVARSLEKRNCVACAVKAFKLVKQKYPRSEMDIVGDGSQREELQRLVAREKLTGVTFTGWLSSQRVAQQFAEADVYVNTSTIDGLPASLVEALAVGLTVVTTGAGGIPQVVADRVNGLIVRTNNPAGLAERIIELVESPELVQRLSERAKLSAKDYSWSRVKDKWLGLYQELYPAR